MRRIVVLCTVAAGVDTVTELVRLGVGITAIVGLANDARGQPGASGWLDVRPIAEQLGIDVYLAASYSLDEATDRDGIALLRPDIILVLGWQRLVPAWLIDLAPEGVLGSHGSCDGITAGRGRSPQNWALMLGASSFELALFRIAPGIDDGPVLASETFVYGPVDDIRVSYHRASLALARMIAKTLAASELPAGDPQSDLDAAYFPQRLAADGMVDWDLSGDAIAAQCRALTRPYPGLRATAGDRVILLWNLLPFDDDISLAAGEIGSIFVGGEFLVGCRTGRILVRDWTCDIEGWQPTTGLLLGGRSWLVSLATIVARHNDRHPGLPVSPRILSILDS